jgi:predicted secreted protein
MDQLKKVFPPFVYMVYNGKNMSALRLIGVSKDYTNGIYYRDGGDWDCSAKYDEAGALFTEKHSMKSISEIKLEQCTFLEWKESNDKYAPNDITEDYEPSH